MLKRAPPLEAVRADGHDEDDYWDDTRSSKSYANDSSTDALLAEVLHPLFPGTDEGE
jgi:hypothetical protein